LAEACPVDRSVLVDSARRCHKPVIARPLQSASFDLTIRQIPP